MRNLSRVSAILGALVGVSGALAFAVAGCGGDDSVSGDAGDGSADGTKPDGKSDAPKGDAPNKKDSPNGDVVTDDGESDGGSDGGSDVTDSGPPSDGAALAAFPNAVNTAYCKQLAFCCDGADASAFQLAECITNFGNVGWLNVGLADVTSGNINYFPAQATKCLADIAALSCATITSTDIANQIATCGQAMVGKLGVGTPGCTSAWDCAPPAYCDNFDGGTGTCQKLVASGSPCKDTNLSTDCSELGNGHPTNYCSSDAGVCAPEFLPGAGCSESFQCQSQICDNTTGLCQDSTIFSDPGVPDGVCAYYNTPP